MPTFAVLDGGAVVARRQIDDFASYPQHKRDALDERGDGGPVLRPIEVEGSGPVEQTIIEANRVRLVKSERPLAEIKAELNARIASDAETCRQRFITPGSGKAMAYLEKHNQAEAVEDLGEAAANALSESDRKAQFPTLAASVGIEAPTLWECAQIVRQRYEAWADISYDIERKELAAKQAISLASDAAAVRAVYEAISWPTP